MAAPSRCRMSVLISPAWVLTLLAGREIGAMIPVEVDYQCGEI